MSGGGNVLPKFMPISFFQGVLVFEVLQEKEFQKMLAISYLVFQACISVLRCLRQEWRISVCALFSHTNPFAYPLILGLGFCTNLAQIFSVFFFWLNHLPERRNLHTGFWYNFCADFGALIYAQIFCADFCAQIFAQIFGAQCADFPLIFAQIFRRFFFGVLAL